MTSYQRILDFCQFKTTCIEYASHVYLVDDIVRYICEECKILREDSQ